MHWIYVSSSTGIRAYSIHLFLSMAHHHSVRLISVPAGRFVAAATLTLRFRTEQSFLGASDEPLRFAAGSRANRCLLRESVSAT